MLNIVLVEPEIPQNTGNVARTCACTHSRLHLVKPMGFTVTDASLKRAGLDYWDKLEIVYYDSLNDFLDKTKDKRLFFFSSKTKTRFTEVSYPPDAFLVFGKETKGLPPFLAQDPRAVTIPMQSGVRCLNLSNAVAVGVYEALRQNNFNFD